MGDFTRIMARDGHEFDVWLAPPQGTPRGALVVTQEIFGVNAHVREVADGFAREGYLAIAPSLFDRVRRNVELGYDADGVQQGVGYMKQITEAHLLLDLQASLNVVKHGGRTGIVGYCWGGTIAHLAACELPVACAVAYYGTRIIENLARRPRVPVMYHFGSRDQSIPPENIEKIRASDPAGTFYVYDADHGFNCDHRATYDEAAAKLARQRTLDFLAHNLAERD
ncbi:MAG: dienelactone hydrolase family protein [Nevskiaceae bacterium]|jgi:carboxymethylenebutenolidase|nr:dienelactone hydrolase family protein [Nevskiaceae bacterium]